MKISQLSVRTLIILPLLLFVLGSAKPTNQTTLHVAVHTLKEPSAYSSKTYSFKVTDMAGKSYPVLSTQCRRNICDVQVVVPPSQPSRSYLISGYHKGNFIGTGSVALGANYAKPKKSAYVSINSRPLGIILLGQLSVEAHTDVESLITQLASIWNITRPTFPDLTLAVVMRTAQYTVLHPAKNMRLAVKNLVTLLKDQSSSSSPPSSPSDLMSLAAVEPDDRGIVGAAGSTEVNNPAPVVALGINDIVGSASSWLGVAGATFHVLTDIIGKATGSQSQITQELGEILQTVNEINSTVNNIETQLESLTNYINFYNLQDSQYMEATLITNLNTLTQPLEDIFSQTITGQCKPVVTNFDLENTNDIITCLQNAGARQYIENNILISSNIMSINTNIADISKAFTDGASYPTGALPTLLTGTLELIGNSGILDMTYTSLWINGPFGIADVTSLNQLMAVTRVMCLYNSLQTLGDYIYKTYPDDNWTKQQTQASFDGQFSVTQQYENQVLTHYAGAQYYETLGNTGVGPILSQSGILTINPQSQYKSGDCIINDYNKSKNAIRYMCDGNGTNPFHFLDLDNCNGGPAYNVWYVNATGQTGDGYWACDDTLVGDSVGASIGGGKKAIFPGYYQHPACTNGDGFLGCADALASVHQNFTIYNQTPNAYPNAIFTQTPTNGYNDLQTGGSNSLYDGGSNYIYSAMIQLSNGAMYEIMHNFLGTNAGEHGTDYSELFLRCPLGYTTDCRTYFGSSNGFTPYNLIIINGVSYWITGSSTSSNEGDWSAIFWDGAAPNVETITTTFSDNAWIWSKSIAGTMASAQLLSIGAPWSYMAVASIYDFASPYGTRYFKQGGLTLNVGQAVQVQTSETVAYQLYLSGNSGLQLFQCINAGCTQGFQLWSSGTGGAGAVTSATFSQSGYLQVYNGSSMVWQSSNTATPSGSTVLALQDDGNLVIYDAGSKPNPYGTNAIWNAGTAITNHHLNGWIQPSGY